MNRPTFCMKENPWEQLIAKNCELNNKVKMLSSPQEKITPKIRQVNTKYKTRAFSK